jgi:integrase
LTSENAGQSSFSPRLVVRDVVRTGSIIRRMAKENAKPKRFRGETETLPSGSLRVKVYVGTDPISKTRMYLRETVPAGPNAEDEAEKVLTRFRHEVYERRHPDRCDGGTALRDRLAAG